MHVSLIPASFVLTDQPSYQITGEILLGIKRSDGELLVNVVHCRDITHRIVSPNCERGTAIFPTGERFVKYANERGRLHYTGLPQPII